MKAYQGSSYAAGRVESSLSLPFPLLVVGNIDATEVILLS